MGLKDKLADKLYADVYGDERYDRIQVSCNEITLEVSPDLYAKLLSQFTAAGGTINGSQASIEGCFFDWLYDAEAQALHITCTKKPWVVGCDSVEKRIRELIEKAKVSL